MPLTGRGVSETFPQFTTARLPDDIPQGIVGMFAIVKRLQQGTRHCLPFQNGMRSRTIPCFRRCSSVVEQLPRNEKVRGSIPRIGTKFALEALLTMQPSCNRQSGVQFLAGAPRRYRPVVDRRLGTTDVGCSIHPSGTNSCEWVHWEWQTMPP